MDQSVVVSLGAGGDQWIGLVGALVGAVLGAAASGYASYVLQKREHERADRVRVDELKQRQKSVAHRLLIKLVAIASDLTRAGEHITENFAAADPQAQPWQYVTPLYQGWTTIALDADESAILLDLDLNKAFNLVGPLPGIHDQMRDANERYAAMRTKLFDLLPEEAFTSTGLALTEQQMRHTKQLQDEMNATLTWLHEETPALGQRAVTALQAARDGFAEKLGITFILAMKE